MVPLKQYVLKDAFFTDSRGDERFHMPIGLVKLLHIAETEPEQFYQPDCARGQCKNQCLCVQLTSLIVHLYLYLYLYCVCIRKLNSCTL